MKYDFVGFSFLIIHLNMIFPNYPCVISFLEVLSLRAYDSSVVPIDGEPPWKRRERKGRKRNHEELMKE